MSALNVPFIKLNTEPGFNDEFLSVVARLVKNTEFVGGPEIPAFEKEIAAKMNAPHAVGCANGTDAIQIALRAAGIGHGDRVLIPDMTFWATFEAVVNVGATPVTADVDENSLHLSHDLFVKALDHFRPQAALLVHLYGWVAPDTEKIRATAKARGVKLIEDCAQALGSFKGGRSVVGEAWIATTSFYPAKVLGASGDAGAVFTQDAEIAHRCAKLVNHGRKTHYSYDMVGWNSRLGAYEAAYLRLGLRHLDARIESRRRACRTYRDELKNLPLKILAPDADVIENGYCSTGIMDSKLREKFRADLQAQGIGSAVIYPGAMSEQEGAAKSIGGALSNGVAGRIGNSVVNLPCYAYMKDEEIGRVIEVVRSVCKNL